MAIRFRAFLAVAGLLAAGGLSRATPPEPRPAVVLITAASLRADRLSAPDRPRDLTPHLARLADQGVLLAEARTPVPATRPALASLLTGREPARHGLYAGGQAAPDLRALPPLLSAAGYSVGVYANLALTDADRVALGLPDDALLDPGLDAHALARAALEAESDRLAAGSRLVWIHFQDLAAPYIPPLDDLLELRGDGRSRAWDFPLPVTADPGARQAIPEAAVNGPLRRAAVYMDAYDATVRDVDRAIGSLARAWLPALRESGGVLVAASLHGEALGEHGLWFSHGRSLYEEEVRVPILFLAPGLRRPGDSPMGSWGSLLDVTPTLLALVGLRDQPGPMEDGMSLAPFLRGSAPPPNRMLAAGLDRAPYSRSLLSERRFKVILTPPRPPMLAEDATWPAREQVEFYDLLSDPLEARNVARERGAVAHDLITLLKRMHPPWPGTPPAEDTSRRR